MNALLPSDPRTSVLIRYFAAARAAAGRSEETLVLAMPATLGDALHAVREGHGRELDRVLERSSFLIDEVAAHGPATPVPNGAVIDVLPPFAGG